MISEKFVILGALINLCGSASYIFATIKGKARPNRVSWALWAFFGIAAGLAQLSEGVGLRSLTVFMTGVGPLLIFIFSFLNKKSYWKLQRLDYICGAIAILSIVAWKLTGDGNVAIVLIILADFFASIPTIIKSYKDPSSESPYAPLAAIISTGILLLTIKDWNFATYGFPIYILLVCIIIFSLVKFRLGDRLREVY